MGIIIDLAKREFNVSPRKLTQLSGRAIALAQKAAQHRRWVPKLELASFAGYVVSLSVALPVARFHLLPIYDVISSVPGWAPFTHVRLSSAAYRLLKFYFSNIPPADIGQTIVPTVP